MRSVGDDADGITTPSRVDVARGINEAEATDPRAQAAVYYAYMDTLHREAREEHGGLRQIVALLREHERNSLVVEHTANTIALLCEGDVATRDVFGSYGALEAVLHTLFTCMPAVRAKERLLHATANLVLDAPRNVLLLERTNFLLNIAKMASSKRYDHWPAIAEHALRIVTSIKYRLDKDYLRVKHKNVDAVPKLFLYCLRAMRVHEGRHQIQEAALDASRALLAAADPRCFSSQLLERACRCAGNAYRGYPSNKNLVWQALALQCDVDDVREAQTDLDVPALFDALEFVLTEASDNRGRHPAWTEAITALVGRALVTAARVGWRNPELKEAAAQAGAVDVCMKALKTFAWNRMIVERVCEVLRSLFDSPYGRERLDCVASARTILEAIETTCKRTELTTVQAE